MRKLLPSALIHERRFTGNDRQANRGRKRIGISETTGYCLVVASPLMESVDVLGTQPA